MKRKLLLFISIIVFTNTYCQVGFSAEKIIYTNANGAKSLHVQDVDNDGDVDVLSASVNDHKICLFRNDGIGNFSVEIITTDAGGASSVYAEDLDSDNDIDILSSSGSDQKIAWYENDGAGNFGPQIVISDSCTFAHCVITADINNDTYIDVLSASAGNDRVCWYENDGSENFTGHTITDLTNGVRSIFAIDLDNDTDIDVISASEWDDKIAWYENTDGAGTFGPQQIISTSAIEAFSVYAEDLDGDNHPDVLSASNTDNKIAWYKNDGTGNFGPQQIISDNAQEARAVYTIDIDGDGDFDVLSASGDDDKIAWYENDGLGNFSSEKVITTSADYAGSVRAADLDNDGDIDVVSASGIDRKIAWYENCSTFGSITESVCLSYTSPSGNHTWEESGIYYDTLPNAVGCDSIITIDLTVQSPYQNQQLCLVSVDPVEGKNKAIWVKNNDVGIESYLVQKEIATNIYSVIGVVPATDTNFFIDYASDPNVHSDLYKITILDTCGNTSELDSSVYHKTINLTLSNVGSTMYLDWEEYEVEDGSYVPPKYYIYRGENEFDLELIDSVTGSVHTYNDNDVYEVYYYMVGAVRDDCDEDVMDAFSNKKDNESIINSMKELGYLPLSIYPNPATGFVTINIPEQETGKIVLKLTDITGKTLKNLIFTSQSPINSEYLLNLNEFSPGIYFIELIGDEIYKEKLIIK